MDEILKAYLPGVVVAIYSEENTGSTFLKFYFNVRRDTNVNIY